MNNMRIKLNHIERICSEKEIWNTYLQLDDADILEIGCGSAILTRQVAESCATCRITALEVDIIQHAKNMKINDLNHVCFSTGPAENIAADDGVYDIVLMFKSLHHVPLEKMDAALNEIRRVLQPKGIVYISEPIFNGDFNDILRLFHDERKARKAAFNAVKTSVDDGRFTLVDEVFFLAPIHFSNFSDFEQKVIGVTHSKHQLSKALYDQVKESFEKKMTGDGANFLMPMRVDILKVRA